MLSYIVSILERLWRGVLIVYASDSGADTANRLFRLLRGTGVPTAMIKYDGDLGRYWDCFDAIVLVMALSGAVRLVCKYAKSKVADPAVVVIDDGGRYVIPILSAHWGANEVAEAIARLMGAEAVITTAAEYMGVTSIEELARLLHCDIVNTEELPNFYSALLSNKPICIIGINELPREVRGSYVIGVNAGCEYIITVGEPHQSLEGIRMLRCVPYKVIIGVGLMNEAGINEVIKAIRTTLNRLGIGADRVLAVASIKPRVGEAAKALGLPFRLVSTDELERVNHGCATPPSDELRRLGVRGVAELAALAAGGTSLLLRKIVIGRVTVAVARV